MADGYTAYKYFTAVKLHFSNESYDLIEQKGHVKGTRETFERRSDRKLFDRLGMKFSKDRDLVQFLIANIAYGNTGLVWEFDGSSDLYYNQWIKRKESITQTFRDDLVFLSNEADIRGYTYQELLYITDDQEYPVILKYYLGGKITIESMVILDILTSMIDNWQPLVLLWHDHFLKIRRLRPFVKFNPEKIRNVYNEFFELFQQSQPSLEDTRDKESNG